MSKVIYHFTDYEKFLQELNSYKGDHYKIVRSGDVAVVTFKLDDVL